jgi:Na+/proline symporter
MFSARDERQSLLATLWFNIAHYAVRPWPWIIVAFVSVLRYPGLENPEEGFIRVMVDLLPTPLKGLMVAAFAAAYMSTIATHLNWGAAYLVNDVYLRFIKPGATDRAQVLVSRLATVVLMVLALVVMRFLGSVEAGWRILLALGAGTGLVLILRWYWWRVNAWSELSAMAASFVVSLTLQYGMGYDAADASGRGYAIVMLWTVGITTVVWLAVTFLTPPEPAGTLDRFYRQVRPGGLGWRVVAARLGFGQDRIPGGALSWVNWLAGCAAVYGTLFGIGQLLVGTMTAALWCLALAAVAFWLIARNLRADATFRSGHVDTTPGSF